MKKDFKRAVKQFDESIDIITTELYKHDRRYRKFYDEYSLLFDCISDCQKGHVCCCSKKTEKLCKLLKKAYGYNFDGLRYRIFFELNSDLNNPDWLKKKAIKRKKKKDSDKRITNSLGIIRKALSQVD